MPQKGFLRALECPISDHFVDLAIMVCHLRRVLHGLYIPTYHFYILPRLCLSYDCAIYSFLLLILYYL
nr:MAG TPA: hypothetical protein [Caudoviricetes sp.]